MSSVLIVSDSHACEKCTPIDLCMFVKYTYPIYKFLGFKITHQH